MGAKSEKHYVFTPELGICIQAVIYKGFAFAHVVYQVSSVEKVCAIINNLFKLK